MAGVPSVTDAVSAKKWDGDGVPLAESNCAGIGTDEDKALRKGAAATEPAWEGAGSKPGVLVWRIEQFKVVAYPEQSYGDFYSGDSYIVLDTVADPESGKLHHTIHFWLGEKTTTDEMGTAAYKTVELDDLLDGEPTQVREVMEHESTAFKALFSHLSYLEGGVETGFHHVAEGSYSAKLLQVRKTNKDGVRVKEVTLARDSLNQGDCFVLDVGATIYVWCGDEASPLEKVAANQAAESIEAKRDGKAKATHDIDDAFWAELGGEGEIKPASAGTDRIPEVDHGEGVLYKLSDTTGSLSTTEVARGDIGAGMLDTNEVMMLDTTVEIFLWVGTGASDGESRNALSTAMAFLRTNNRPSHTPVHVFKEGTPIRNETWKGIMASGPAKAPAAAPAAAPPSVAAEAAGARLHTTSPAATAASDAAAGTMSLEDLQNPAVWKPAGVDPTNREVHLADDVFQATFGMAKADFAKQPKWKKDSEKKKHNLF